MNTQNHQLSPHVAGLFVCSNNLTINVFFVLFCGLSNFAIIECSAFEQSVKVLQIQYSKLNVSMPDTFKKFIKFIT